MLQNKMDDGLRIVSTEDIGKICNYVKTIHKNLIEARKENKILQKRMQAYERTHEFLSLQQQENEVISILANSKRKISEESDHSKKPKIVKSNNEKDITNSLRKKCETRDNKISRQLIVTLFIFLLTSNVSAAGNNRDNVKKRRL